MYFLATESFFLGIVAFVKYVLHPAFKLFLLLFLIFRSELAFCYFHTLSMLFKIYLFSALRAKLANRPARGHLVQQGILPGLIFVPTNAAKISVFFSLFFFIYLC